MKAAPSISVQILLAVLITVASVLGVSSIIELNVLKRRDTASLQERGALTADRIANSLAYPLWNLNPTETERVVLDEIGSTDVSRIRVFDEDGAIYVGKVRGPDGAIRNVEAANAGAAVAPNAALYSFSRDVNFRDARIGSVTLDVTDANLQAEISNLRWGIAIKLLLVVALLSVVLFVALRVLVIRPVSTLKSWVERVPSGSASHPPHFRYSGEINSLANAFARMSVNLRRKNEELEGEQGRLRALSARLQSAREEEGMRIAREIHDELGGALTGLKWDLEGIDKILSGAENGGKIDSVQQKIPTMTGLIESTITTVRRISSELRPGILDDLGLIAAIEWQAQQFQSRTGIKCHSDTTLETVELDRESATAVFRIFQEILTNVLRHAQATKFHVKLREQDGYLELEVSDDGRGITESEKGGAGSLGILGMKERALLVGGEVNIVGRDGSGTTVIVRVPLRK